ncbi:MAG: ABC transporter ATP-binding protein [Desulfobacterales bacterium]|nr:ABC transporter ATP-binding protein [Desulfobacterales bacterium]
MTDALTISNLSYDYAGTPVLADVSFSTAQGEFFIIIGPNGSGKTTLMKIMAGVLRCPDHGPLIFGKALNRYGRKELARCLAFVPQSIPADFPFTVREAALMGRSPHQGILGLERDRDMEIVEQAMDFTEVRHLADRRIDQLSGGERQRVFIARAICQEPKIMLLDEPTASLDLSHQARLMDLLDKLKRDSGVTVVMVSHDLNLAAMYADRLLLLRAGKVVRIGPPDQVLTFGALEPVYGCTLLVDVSPLGNFPRITLVPERFKTLNSGGGTSK